MTQPAKKKNVRPRGAWLLSAGWVFRDVFRALWKESVAGFAPMVLLLLALAVLLSILTALSPIAPFVYPLF